MAVDCQRQMGIEAAGRTVCSDSSNLESADIADLMDIAQIGGIVGHADCLSVPGISVCYPMGLARYCGSDCQTHCSDRLAVHQDY